MTRLARRHAFAIVFAILFGIALSGPYLAVRSANGIYPELVNDQNYYLAQIEDVRNGFLISGNAYLAEYKNAPSLQFPLGEIIMGETLNAFSLGTGAVFTIFPPLFGPILFLLIYAIACMLRVPRPWALLAAVLLCYGLYFSEFMRLVSPQFNFIFWLLAVLGLFMLPERPTWRWWVPQAIVVGLLFYIYPYYWTHIGVAYTLLFIYYSLVRDRAVAASVFLAGLGALAIGSGYIAELIQAHALPWYASSMERVGLVYTHFPSGFALALVAAAVGAFAGIVVWKLRRLDRPVTIGFALLAASVIAMNQHVFTGQNVEFSSHYKLQVGFSCAFLLIALAASADWWQHLSRRLWYGIAVAAVACVAAFSLTTTYHRTVALAAASPVEQYAPVVAWLGAHTAPDSVVYAPDALAALIPAYTADDVFYTRTANIFFLPQADVTDRFIIQNYYADFTTPFISENERALFGVGYIDRYAHAVEEHAFLRLLGIHTQLPARIPDTAIADVIARAKALQSLPLDSLLAHYRVDYFTIATDTVPEYRKAGVIGATPLMSANGFAVYAKAAP
ncbi:MAG TPA: hypothetical protein VMV50_00595 [Candidatus Paceibacterota bacterium]|nr:hypothetical protein [Candidatus Paceibacterota bacterium]